jgi:ribose/xylose/arabinose/galactoside ABC-type transport system permease subunit
VFAYTGFFSAQVFLNLLIDNAFLMHRGGRHDLRDPLGRHRPVGGLGDRADDHGVGRAGRAPRHWSPLAVIPLVLVMGTAFGAFMGLLIERFRLQPFIVTLAGMFLARGLCYLISIDSISITNAFYTEVSQMRIPVLGRAPRCRWAR